MNQPYRARAKKQEISDDPFFRVGRVGANTAGKLAGCTNAKFRVFAGN
jgi:hypothetical protein